MTDHADFHDEPTAGNLFEDATDPAPEPAPAVDDAPWLATAEALDAADPWTAPATDTEPAADPWDEASWGADAWAEPEPAPDAEGDGWEEDVRTQVADWGDEPLLEAAVRPRRRSPLRRFAQLGAAAFAVLVVLTVVAGLLGGSSQPAARTTPTAVAVTPRPAPVRPLPAPRAPARRVAPARHDAARHHRRVKTPARRAVRRHATPRPVQRRAAPVTPTPTPAPAPAPAPTPTPSPAPSHRAAPAASARSGGGEFTFER